LYEGAKRSLAGRIEYGERIEAGRPHETQVDNAEATGTRDSERELGVGAAQRRDAYDQVSLLDH
jgi:hypothetical protein